MKTYILHNLDKIAKYSKALDAKAILYDKNWEVFNEDGDKEVLIFRPKGELLIVKKGIVTKSNWELLPTGSILITTDGTTCLFNAAFVDENVLALQLDGTSECMVMIESNKKESLRLNTIQEINKYLDNQNPETVEVSNTQENTDTDYGTFLNALIVIASIMFIMAALTHC